MGKLSSRWLLALCAAGLSVASARAGAADYATIVLTVDVARPASEVWKKVGSFCDIGASLKMTCTYTSGSGNLGTVRLLAGRIQEVMVAQTAHSYTYTQPDTKVLYHGTLAVEPAGRNRSKLIYSLFYDQSGLTEQAKAQTHEQRAKAFTRVLQSMKSLAESQ